MYNISFLAIYILSLFDYDSSPLISSRLILAFTEISKILLRSQLLDCSFFFPVPVEMSLILVTTLVCPIRGLICSLCLSGRVPPRVKSSCRHLLSSGLSLQLVIKPVCFVFVQLINKREPILCFTIEIQILTF